MRMCHVHGGAFVAHIHDAHAELGQVVPDRLDVAALQAEDAVDAACDEEARHPFGDAAVRGRAHGQVSFEVGGVGSPHDAILEF